MAQQDKPLKGNSEYINPYEVTPDKPFHIAFLREITDQYDAGEISYGKMVEMLNDVAMKWHEQQNISKKETQKNKTNAQIKITQTTNADMNIGVSKTQTALTYFIEQLSLNVDITNFYEGEDILTSINKLHNLIDYAKQMEKEQIKDAYIEGCFDSILHEKTDKSIAEQYYRETYK